MMNTNVMFSSARMDWETPQDIYDRLNAVFGFTLDPCCSTQTAKCDIYFTEAENGLKQTWGGHKVFMNPPYGRDIGEWMKKAYNESLNGAIVVCLVPARTDTRWWWDYCMKGDIGFIKGRLKFRGKNKRGESVSHAATFPSSIVIFGGDRGEFLPRLKSWVSFAHFL